MTTAELILRAVAHIEQYGFVPNEYFDDSPVNGECPPPGECRTCPAGAIAVAAGRHPMFGDDPFAHATEIVIVDPDDADLDDLCDEDKDALANIKAAENALADHLRTKFGDDNKFDHRVITDWADQHGRTQAEVTAEMTDCAENLPEDYR